MFEGDAGLRNSALDPTAAAALRALPERSRAACLGKGLQEGVKAAGSAPKLVSQTQQKGRNP